MVIKPFRFKTSGNQRKPWDAGGLKEVTSRFCTSWKVWAFSIDPCFFMVYYLWCFSILVTCSFSGFFQFKGDFLLRRPKQLKTLWLNSSELTDLQQFFFYRNCYKSRNLIDLFIVVDKSPYHAARVNASSNAFFSLRTEKNTFSLTLILW